MAETPVRVFEMGERPRLFTKARRFAPQAALVFADLIANAGFADLGIVVIDWNDVTDQQPVETRKPVMFLQAIKWLDQYTEGNKLTVESRIDIDNVFGSDTMTSELLRDIVHELGEKVRESVAQRVSEED